MPQLDFTSLPSQLFWLAICFMALYFLMSKVTLPIVTSVLQGRQEKISGDLEAASSMSKEAESMEKEYGQSLAAARQKANSLISAATEEIAKMHGKKMDELAASLAERNREMEAKIETARKKAIEELSSISAELAEVAVNKLVEMKPRKKGQASADQAKGVKH